MTESQEILMKIYRKRQITSLICGILVVTAGTFLFSGSIIYYNYDLNTSYGGMEEAHSANKFYKLLVTSVISILGLGIFCAGVVKAAISSEKLSVSNQELLERISSRQREQERNEHINCINLII